MAGSGMTSEAIRQAVHAIIAADLSLTETRAAVMAIIPKEHLVNHH